MMIDISDIKASVQSKALIQVPCFRNAQFLKDKRGRLLSYSGGFTVVMPCIVNGEKWAFRCWHTPVDDSKKKYGLINDAIQHINLPYFCSFEYIENGLVVNGESLPITKMKWADGENLKKYISNNYLDSIKIKRLASSFRKMVSDLHTQGIAHGDLQHGNIIVSKSGQLLLVDYDSMYVPSMRDNFQDTIKGLIDYQHPARNENKISSKKLDYFSELVIYTSLISIAQKPELAIEYDIENTEGLLFFSTDFDSFESSKIYSELSALKNSEIDNCLSIFMDYLSAKDINDLQPMESYFMSINISAPKIVVSGEDCIIKWTSSGAKHLCIKGIGDINPSGEIKTNISTTTTYTFILTSESGATKEEAIQIEAYRRGKINHFVPERKFTFSSIPIIISWNCQDMVDVEIVGYGKQSEIGSLEAVINDDQVFEIQAKDHFSKFSQKFTVKVLPLPSIKSLRTPTYEAEYKSNISIRPSRIDIRPLVSKTSICNHLISPKIDLSPIIVKTTISPLNIDVHKGSNDILEKISHLIENMYRTYNQCLTKFVNYIIKTNK